jgi:hypothetical protein
MHITVFHVDLYGREIWPVEHNMKETERKREELLEHTMRSFVIYSFQRVGR